MSFPPDIHDVLDKYGVSSVNEKGDDGWTALMNAVIISDKYSVEMLLDNGADLEMRDNDKRTALYIAVSFAITDMTQLLLERGADFNTYNNAGYTPLAYAQQREVIYRGTATGNHFADIIKLLEAWPEMQQPRVEEQQRAPPPPKRHPGSPKHWRF